MNDLENQNPIGQNLLAKAGCCILILFFGTVFLQPWRSDSLLRGKMGDALLYLAVVLALILGFTKIAEYRQREAYRRQLQSWERLNHPPRG